MEGSNRDDGSPGADGEVDKGGPLVGTDGQVGVLDQPLEATLEEGRDEDHQWSGCGFSKTSCDSAMAVHEVYMVGNVDGKNDDRNMGTYVV